MAPFLKPGVPLLFDQVQHWPDQEPSSQVGTDLGTPLSVVRLNDRVKVIRM